MGGVQDVFWSYVIGSQMMVFLCSEPDEGGVWVLSVGIPHGLGVDVEEVEVVQRGIVAEDAACLVDPGGS